MDSEKPFFKRYAQPIFWVIAWATSFIGWYMSSLYPSPLWGFMIWGPFIGGALVTALADGRPGTKTYFSRIVRWRVGFQWYLVAIFLPVALRVVALGLNILSGATIVANPQFMSGEELIFEIIFIIFFISLGEEPGFRGFALPRLLVGRSALAASLILGVLHAIWHLPLFLFNGDSPISVPIIISGAVFFTWLFNHTKGSVLLAMILHASVDISLLFFNPLFAGAEAERQTVWLVAVFVAAATLLVVVTGRELGRKPETSLASLPAEPVPATK
ncbi:MAG: CPBP family intramembrane glutamic endopeptidase [Caldilineales bacterium]